MPLKPARACRAPGCSCLTSDHSGYCDSHNRQSRRIQDTERGSAAERGYTYRWQQSRLQYLRNHPLCVECEREGKVEAAVVVDHIKAHRGDYDLFWDESNWQSLCKYHHDIKTAKEDGGFGNYAKRNLVGVGG